MTHAMTKDDLAHIRKMFGYFGGDGDAPSDEDIQAVISAWQSRTPAPVDHAALAEKLEAWSTALKDKSNRAMTVDYLTYVNGECVTIALDKAATALRAHPAGGVSDELERMLLDLLARIHGDGGQYSVSHGLDKSYHDANLIVAALRAAGMTQPPSGYVSEYNGASFFTEHRPTTIPDANIFPVWRAAGAGVVETPARCEFCGEQTHICRQVGKPSWDACPRRAVAAAPSHDKGK